MANKYLAAVKASGSVTGRLGVGVSGDGRKGRPNAKVTKGSLRSTKFGVRMPQTKGATGPGKGMTRDYRVPYEQTDAKRPTKVGSRASTISEDSPQFDPVTMGNRKYGPGARRPDGSVMKRGTGPGPNGSYPAPGRRRKRTGPNVHGLGRLIADENLSAGYGPGRKPGERRDRPY